MICRRAFISTLVLASLSACAGLPVTPAASETPAPQAAGNALPQQQLEEGECGLFLWTQKTPRRLIFFAKAGESKARAHIDGQDMSVSLTGSGGTNFGQFMTQMDYTPIDGTGVLRLALQPGEVLESGQRTKEATLYFTDAEGWETLIPVRGVRVCMDEPKANLPN